MLNHGNAEKFLLLCDGMSFDVNVRGWLPMYHSYKAENKTLRFWKVAVEKYIYCNYIKIVVTSVNGLSMSVLFRADGDLTEVHITNSHRKYMWAKPYLNDDGTLKRTFEHNYELHVKEVYDLQFI